MKKYIIIVVAKVAFISLIKNKSVNVIKHYRTKEGKEHMVISVAAGKALDKILYSFILLKSKNNK